MLEAVVSLRLAMTRLGMLERRLVHAKEMGQDAEEIDKILTQVKRLQLILEALALRLETLANTGIFAAEELAIVKYVLQELRREYRTVIPGLEALIDDVLRNIIAIASETRIELPKEPTPHIAQAAEEILRAAEKAAESQEQVERAKE